MVGSTLKHADGEMTMTEYNDDEELDETDEDEDPYETPLAKEFAQHCTDIGKLIDAKVDVARKALKEATDLAEKHGVPFRAGISPLSNTYMPASFSYSKFAKLDQEVICEIAEVWGDYLFEGGGWIHSAVC
jgi:hypothetical protein